MPDWFRFAGQTIKNTSPDVNELKESPEASFRLTRPGFLYMQHPDFFHRVAARQRLSF